MEIYTKTVEQMRFWIEVSREAHFRMKLNGEEGLYAPFNTRYLNMLKEVKPGDIVLHYIIQRDAFKKDHGSSVIGISIVGSESNIQGSRITVDLDQTISLPCPISKNEIENIENMSELLKKLIRQRFQRYFSEISHQDFQNIISLQTQNHDIIKHSRIKNLEE